MAKEIFNTSEKSNFILNLTEEKYSDIASKSMAGLFVLCSLFAIPELCIENVGFTFTTAGLMIAGVVCMILSLIAAIKKYIGKAMLVPVIAFGVILVFGTISMINGYDLSIGFYGFDGRGEGLLSLIFYFCFFLTGLTLKTEKSIANMLGGVIAAGALNSIWAVIQVFTGKLGHFAYVSLKLKVCAASGLAQNPIFLAMLLTLSLTAALIGFVMTKSSKIRITLAVCAALFSFTMMLTYTIIGILGIALALISSAAAVFLSKAPKIRLAGLLTAVIPPIVSVILVSAGLIGDVSGYKLYDGRIMWWDSYNRLSSSGLYDPRIEGMDMDIEDPLSVYGYMTDKTLDIIKDYPIAGSGPDQLVYPQMHTSKLIIDNPNTFDRIYNEFLYTAATRGIPSMLALLTVIASTIGIAAGILNRNRRSYAYVCTFFMLVSGTVLMFIGVGSIMFSPIFWAAAGASCAAVKEASKKTTSKKHEKAYGKKAHK